MRLILQAARIKKQYGIRTVLDFEGIQIYEGDKIGVVGVNGAGKTTLLGILSGEIQPDEGTVTRRCDVGYIRQFEEDEEGEPTLSGGENVKKRIQREVGLEDSIVFADEPTANLDADGVKWLRGKLLAAKTVLLISHDRQLLDDVCSRMIEIRDGRLYFYTGNYSVYLEKIAKTRERQETEHAQYERQRDQLVRAVQIKEQKAARIRRQQKVGLIKNSSEMRNAKDQMASKQKKAEHDKAVLKARLERLEKVDKPGKPPKFRMDFLLTDPPQNKQVVTCRELSFAYGGKSVFRDAEFVIPGGSKTAITGKNGSGKSTLLRLIYEGHAAIVKAPKLKLGYFRQDLGNLDPGKTVLDNVLAVSVQDRASVYSILAGLLFREDGFYKKAGVLSGGEKIRLSVAMLVASDCNALMLDEPTNYLDIPSVEAVQRMIQEYPGTVILVSHDDYFVRETTNRELRLERGRIISMETTPSAGAASGKNRRAAEESSESAAGIEKMMLDMRRAELAARIAAAPPEEKEILERQYAALIPK
ncbi:MAG: ATP-binding cassette domain-containing protein [Peptococcaceae bacterium]|jgi:macrolide transport system ATP-binding/permease protein|nr:ATP-binding cassette domain-containing protein [Peptococcaceae bacterium]